MPEAPPDALLRFPPVFRIAAENKKVLSIGQVSLAYARGFNPGSGSSAKKLAPARGRALRSSLRRHFSPKYRVVQGGLQINRSTKRMRREGL